MRAPMSARKLTRRRSACPPPATPGAVPVPAVICSRRALRSAVERERALQRVVVLYVEIDAELLVLRAVAWRLADEHRRSGNGRENCVGERRGVARRALIRLELGVARAADLKRTPAALNVESNRHALHGDHFADELHQLADRPAELAGVHLEDRFFLRRRRIVGNVDGRAPVSLQYVAGNVRDQRDRRAFDVDAFDRSLVETPRHDRVAGAEVRILSDPAGTQDPTVAHFQQTTFEVISHDALLKCGIDTTSRGERRRRGWLWYCRSGSKPM